MFKVIGSIVCSIALVLMTGCASLAPSAPASGRWISLDHGTQRFTIAAQQVPRGDLIDELQSVSGVAIRGTLDRQAPVTAQGSDLDLNALLALLVPADARIAVRPGASEMTAVVAERARPKRGAPVQPPAGAQPKPDTKSDVTPTKPSGNVKIDAGEKYEPREVTGAGAKRPTAELLRASTTLPKQPSSPRMPAETIRIVLEFEDGVPPRLVDARAIEGRAPRQRFVVGSFVYVVVGADGRVVEAGTFQDPLLEHSYLPEGPHSTGRAHTGTAGISIARDSLAGATLRVVDMTGIPLPRELDEQALRIALERGKPVVQIDTAVIARRLQEEARK